MKHTPGPWRYEKRSDRVIYAGDESLFCDMRYYPWCSANEADWPLVAAAPELLDALRRVIELAEGGFNYRDIAWQSAHAEARAAIAKAEGEGEQ